MDDLDSIEVFSASHMFKKVGRHNSLSPGCRPTRMRSMINVLMSEVRQK